jgi:rod shape determining protein RodA
MHGSSSAIPSVTEPVSARFLRATHMDFPLLAGLLVLCAIGLIALYSAGGQSESMIVRQVIRLGVGFAAMIVIARIDPQTLRTWTPWLFGISFLLLAAVPLIGASGHGAQRWIDLQVVRFQPSELLKLTVPMAVAWYLYNRNLPMGFRNFVVVVVIVAAPTALIVMQPDLGTAILVAVSGFFGMFLAGLRWRIIFAVPMVLAVAAPVAWMGLRPYQKERILTFLSPESDPLGRGWNIIQSKIAIGSGGLYGKGLFNGTQSHLEFLPERNTDFILAVIGEEFGLYGILALLGVYAWLVIRGLMIALEARDTYSRLLAGSLSLTFFVYVFVNAGMVTGLLPVVGVPLPLVSYGGTSMVTLLVGFGILMSIQTHRRFLNT